MKNVLLAFYLMLIPFVISAQINSSDSLEVFDYTTPQEFEVGGVTVAGAFFSDENAVIGVSGLKVGSTIRIPGFDIPKALKNLWRLRLFTNVDIIQTKTVGDVIFLEINVTERPRLSRYSYRGVKKAFHDNLNDEVDRYMLRGGIVTEDTKVNAAESIRQFFVEKGFLDTEVDVEEVVDTSRVNAVRIVFAVDQKERVKIANVHFEGNQNIKDNKLRKKMSSTKEKRRLFANSKLIREEYDLDKESVIAYYNTIGYRDARIISDSMWRNDKGELEVQLNIYEGNQYFFRDIVFKGNSIYTTETLESVLAIESGDVYNQELLETRLSFSQDGRDVSTLYMDDGYLFFQVDPIETAIEGDSIDLELRIFEGPQATIDKVTIVGNDRTHEHVIRRELRTRPGDKFSRSDIIRSQRQLMNLNYFNPENLGINTPVNPNRGTVDIEYSLEEKPSDQLELSAGWGGQRRVIGTLGVTFNNFSLRNIMNREAWHPLPQGDGQRLSLRAQTNGDFYQSYNVSFTEPWLGGKKPTSLTVSGFFNRFTNGGTKGTETYQSFNITQLSVSLGTRLRWPDDNFISRTGVNIQTLNLQNWSLFNVFRTDQGEIVRGGYYNNFSITQTFARNTINDPLFPQEGSNISLMVQFTPPYSLFSDKDYDGVSAEERFRWLEYHKWRIDAEWYTALVGKLILKAQAKIGVLGAYTNEIGISPFERFQVGGDGINNQQFGYAGVDIISSRGYEIADFPNNTINNQQEVATPLFDKFTIELRYPISLNPSSTIYVLAFAQGANAWRDIKDFNPFDVQRSVGAGLRVFLPMFGTLGFDYGIGFDKLGPRTLQNMGDFNIILGFEPE